MREVKYDEKQITIDKKSGLKLNDIMKKHNIKSVKTIYDIIERNGRDHFIANKRYQVDENYFENIDNQDKAYWLGFLYADGYVRIYQGRSGQLKLKLKDTDKCHIELMNKCLKSNYPIKFGLDKVIVEGREYISKSETLSIFNTKMVKDLMKHGCVNKKSFIIEFPELREDLIRHFIRGYFDGDGCISISNNKKRIFICSGSEKFMKLMKNILEKETDNHVSFGKRLNKKSNNSIYYIDISSKNGVNDIYHYMYDESDLYLERKFEKFKK